MHNGDEIFNDIIKFVSNNKETISNISNVVGTVDYAVGKISTNAIDEVKKN